MDNPGNVNEAKKTYIQGKFNTVLHKVLARLTKVQKIRNNVISRNKKSMFHCSALIAHYCPQPVTSNTLGQDISFNMQLQNNKECPYIPL